MNGSLTKTAALALGLLITGAAAAGPGAWVTSWHASPQPVWGNGFVLPTNVPTHLENQTLRETVRLSAGGTRLRLVFSNRYGREPVLIGGVTVGQGHAVSFGGQASATLAAGSQLISDPVAMPVKPLAQLTVTSYFPQRTPIASFHWGEQQSIHAASGNRGNQPGFTPESTIKARLFLSAVLVETPTPRRVIVALGDSITDGNGSTPDQNRRWPDYLARRLAPQGIAVANAGISGARLLRDGMGVAALARLEQDVLSQPGVTDLIVLLGINDIGWPGSPFAPAERPVTLDELVAGYSQLIAGARARGVRITGATLPPFKGALQGTPFEGHYSVAKDALRQAFNHWIRTEAELDAVVDFDAVLRDPRHPSRLLPRYDSGDHLHPGDAGYEAMAKAVAIR